MRSIRLVLRHDLDGAVVVAVPIVGVVQMPIHQIANMISVGNRWVPASRAMNVVRVVPAAVVPFGASVGIGAADFNHVFVDMVAMRVMKVTIMKIVDMTIMLDGNMTASGAMNMSVIGVDFTVAHAKLLFSR